MVKRCGRFVCRGTGALHKKSLPAVTTQNASYTPEGIFPSYTLQLLLIFQQLRFQLIIADILYGPLCIDGLDSRSSRALT